MIPFHLPHIRGRRANAIHRQVPKSICGVKAPHERMDLWLMGWVTVPSPPAACCPVADSLRSYAENDAQRPLLEVKADSHVAVR